MEFTEIIKSPEFTLKMTLQEAINLWKIVSNASIHGFEGADKFVDALHDFAANSNSYNEYL
jgi:hypothetical protein